jgi:two-component system, chemotaxis family, response regulator Rcp1
MAMLKSVQPIEILLVEDNLGDIRLTEEALKENKLKVNLSVATDGEQAMDILFKRGEYQHSSRPDIVLLDLNLPKKDGRQVLEEIKSSEDLKAIPVVVLTTSRAEEDILSSYLSHANCYITKPVDVEQFIRLINSLENFWFSIVKLPKE